jgi:hypothetical protein
MVPYQRLWVSEGGFKRGQGHLVREVAEGYSYVSQVAAALGAFNGTILEGAVKSLGSQMQVLGQGAQRD